MILGMSLSTFTFLHVLLSLIGIGSGFIVVLGLIAGNRFPRWTALFLVSTALTSLTGFLFPNKTITPGIVLGVLSLISLLLAAIALYGGRLSGAWRGTYVIDAALSLYFNFFVLIAQLFAKVPALKAIAPTPAAPAFGITQLIVLALFAALTVLAYRKFRAEQGERQRVYGRSSASSK
ncbi:MAG: hypothetical protein ABR905_10035 [Terracidiphilus sp.]|jgi:hypothetical protein